MPGKVTIELPDATKYETEYPQIEVSGLMSTQKVLNPVGTLSIKDLTNNYELKVTFDAEQGQRSSGVMSFFSSTPEVGETGGEQYRRDLLTVEIFKLGEEGAQPELVSKA